MFRFDFRSALVFALLLTAGCGHIDRATSPEPTVQTIVFGSCAAEDEPQPIWKAITAQDPDLFLFIGDNIYADTEDMVVMRRKYAQLGDQPGFRTLRSETPVLAVWDDHDYGANDAGADYPKREESEQIFLDFFEVPEDAPPRQRPGIYDAQTFGPPGRRVQVILLDTRYFRSPLERWPEGARETPGPYRPVTDPDATLLGEAQWTWLKKQLEKPADVRLLVSSIQVLSDEHGWETWGNFPRERERLFQLIRDTGASGLLLLSGDRHLAELTHMPPDEAGLSYPLYDLTSSSLNRPSGGNDNPNSRRIGRQYRPINFGLVAVNWDRDDPVVDLTVRDEDGQPVLQHAVSLSELQPDSR